MTVNFLDSDLRISEWELTEHLTLLSIRPCTVCYRMHKSPAAVTIDKELHVVRTGTVTQRSRRRGRMRSLIYMVHAHTSIKGILTWVGHCLTGK